MTWARWCLYRSKSPSKFICINYIRSRSSWRDHIIINSLFISKLLKIFHSCISLACIIIIMAIIISYYRSWIRSWYNSNISDIKSSIWEKTIWLSSNTFVLCTEKSCIIFATISSICACCDSSYMCCVCSITVLSFNWFYHRVI